jgi:hypothetical protein
MMKVKYIGLTFEEEVEQLVGTLISTNADYIRYNSDPNVLTFQSHEAAAAAHAHIKHFLFSCKLADIMLDDKNIVFVRRSHSPIVLSDSFKKKRDEYLQSLIQDQILCVERMLKADERKYKRKGNVFYFKDEGGISTVVECLTLDPKPTSKFGYGLLNYRMLAPLVVEIFPREDIPL